MIEFEFRQGYMSQTYIEDGVEHFVFGQTDGIDVNLSKINFDFPKTLLYFQRMDLTLVEQLFFQIAENLKRLDETHDEEVHRELTLELGMLGAYHTYFVFVYYDWELRLRQAKKRNYENLSELLPIAEVTEMLPRLIALQGQVTDLFRNVLDIDGEKKPVPQRMAEYHAGNKWNVFPFSPLPMSFELSGGVYTEVLTASSIYDLIDFFLRQMILREVRLRVCKHCGKYFAITGKSTTEYCELTRDEKNRTCKEIGAIQTWAANKKDDELFKLYRREYKRRFVWTKTGKISSQKLYDWGSQAREMKQRCEDGKITLEEFQEWLKKE